MNDIQKKIKNTINDFYNYPWSNKEFLTEDDVRCRLFLSLNEILKNESNLSIHSEVRWYGNDQAKKLKCRTDLVIIDDTNLKVTNKLFTLPSKGYGFDKYYAILEIKLRRKNGKSDKEFKSLIQSDIDKLKEIKRKTSNNKKGYFVIVFDKKKNKKCLIENIDNKQINFEKWNEEN